MANNFFGKLRGLVSSAWSEADVQPTHNSPAQATAPEASQLSSVERYLAKQAAAQAASEPKALTGVERYLAKYVVAVEEPEASKAPLTSVEKYLAKQAGASKTEATKPAAPLSKVDKYLASQSSNPAKDAPAPAKKTETPAKSAPAAKKKSEVAEKASVAAPKETVKKAPPAAAQKEPTAKKSAGVTDLSIGANQCQAGTTKGTQCRNTLRLNQLQLEINGKTYLFAACNQHNNTAFKPFQPV